MKIGVLALQGAFAEHIKMFEMLGAETLELRQKEHCTEHMDGIVLPGGESTVMGKLLKDTDMYDIIKSKIMSGLPVFGTCAGLLLLAGKIKNDKNKHFALMNITAVRNGFGRQLGSFETIGKFNGNDVPMTFIRAPYIENTGENAKVLAKFENKTVAVRQDNMLAVAFHPEVTNSFYVHKYFMEMCFNT